MTEVIVYNDTPETGELDYRKTHARSGIDRARDSSVYRNSRAGFRAQEMAKGSACCLCGEEINYRLRYPHPRSWSLEHRISVKDRPDLLLDVTNWDSAHLDCNYNKGTGDAPLDLGEPSEIW